jgi:type I thyroxine 5'-deiodinase
VIFASPRNAEERAGIATACVRNLGLETTALLDNPANTTEAAYTGWPDRLYAVDREGRIAFKCALSGGSGARSDDLPRPPDG